VPEPVAAEVAPEAEPVAIAPAAPAVPAGHTAITMEQQEAVERGSQDEA
jgi:hypothetical protein